MDSRLIRRSSPTRVRQRETCKVPQRQIRALYTRATRRCQYQGKNRYQRNSTIRVALSRHRRSLQSEVHLIDTNKWRSFAPTMPSRRIFSMEGKAVQGVWNPSPSFIPPVTEQAARLSSGRTWFRKTPDQPELENIYISSQ